MQNLECTAARTVTRGNWLAAAKNLLALAPLLLLPMLAARASFAADELFVAVPQSLKRQSATGDAAPRPGYARTRQVLINSAMLAPETPLKRQSAAIAADGPSFILNLFDDTKYPVIIEKTVSRGTGRYISYGEVQGYPQSRVILSVNDGIVSATISVPGRPATQISYAGGGYHTVGELDPASTPGCSVIPVNLPPGSGADVPATAGTANTRVDIMVVYTAAARSGAGGTTAMQSLIDLAVAEANDAYANSGINVTLNLVYTGEISYNESGNASTDLNRLQNPSDGQLDSVHSLRTQYGADTVVLITESMATYAGLSFVMSPPSTAFSGYAFSVVKREYAAGTYTFAHEVGHVMGCMHDRENATSGGAYDYSYGYRFSDGTNTYRTVMAYAPGARIPYFSSPSINYNGAATGVAGGATNAADNALTINNTAATVAAFASTATFIEFEITSTNVTEANTTLTLNVLREGDTSTNATVQYTTTGAGATAGLDYTAASGTITFATGETNKTVNLAILNDSIVESNEVVRLVLSNPTNAVLGTARSVDVTILDDDTGFSFAASTANISEGGTNIVINVRRTGDASGTNTIDYATSDLSAAAGDDYTSTNGTLTFNAGETNKTITVPILADNIIETNETFKVTLSNPDSGAALGSISSMVVTILEDDSTIQFSSTAVSALENAGTVTLTVTRTGGTNSTATVDYVMVDDTATDGSDYTATNGTLSFAPGVKTKTFTIPLLNDTNVEGNETFNVLLTNAVSATLGTNTNTVVTIQDNDSSFEFSTNALSAAESGRSVTVTVVRTGGTAGSASVHYATADGTATSATDYTSKSGTLSFASGETNKTFTVSLKTDTTYETNETFTIGLGGPSTEASLGTVTNLTVTITDTQSYLSFETNSVSAAEGDGTVTLTVNRTGALTETNTLAYSFRAGTAGTSDYKATNGTLTFLPDATNATITVGIVDDNIVESNETFTVTISSPKGGASISGTNTAVVTIDNTDTGFAFTASSYSANEDGTNVTLTVVRTGDLSATNTIDYATSDLSATAGSDYTATNGTLTFPPGTNSLAIVVPITDDSALETNETFQVSLSNPVGARLLTLSNAVVKILENDSTLALSTNAVSVNENAGTATVAVLRSGGTNVTITVDYFTVDGTGTNAVDYTSTNGTLTFGPGVAKQTVIVPLVNNSTVDGDRTFSLNLTNASGADLGAVTNATFTIHDNDSTIEFSTNALTVAETDRSVLLTLTRTGGLIGSATVHYATSNQTATASSDFTTRSGVVTFKANETNKTISIPIANDSTNESNEVFNVLLTSPTGEAQLGTNDTVAVTITDNDSLLSFSTNAVSVSEGAGTVTLNVLRTGTLTQTNTIAFTVTAGTAGTADYKATNATLTFLPDATNATITIAITDDTLVENDETFSVKLSNPKGGAAISGTNTAVVTILENDTGIQFSSPTYQIAESGTNVVLTVVQTGATNVTNSVDYFTSDISATAGSDYTATNGTLTFGPGTNSLTITIPITNDSTIESNETFRVSLTNAPGMVFLAASNAIVTILENDSTFALSTNAASFAEDSGLATIRVLRGGGTNDTITVDYFTTDGTGTNAVDYTGTNGTLTFGPGVASQTISVPILNNTNIEGDRTFSLTLTNAAGADFGDVTNVVFTILDNDSVVQFSTNAVTAAETSGSAVLTITRTGGLIAPATVHYATADASAASGADYTTRSGTLKFAAGETNKIILIPIKNDVTVETNETFSVVLSSPTGEALLGSNSTATVTIADNDSHLAFETNAVTVSEGAGTVTLTINRTGTLTTTNTLSYAIVPGTAGKNDYTGTNGTITFAPGETNATITLGIVDDTLVESDETFSVKISNPKGGAAISGTNVAYITITENDIGLAFAATSYSASEAGTNVTLTVVQTGNTNTTNTVDYFTSDISATAASDYGATNGTLTFGPGTNSLTITISITNDTELETNETFAVSLTNASSAILLASNVVVTILEDDSSFSLATNAITAKENAGTADITVLRTGGTNDSITVDFLTADGTGTNAVDYTATNGTLTFGPGVKSQTISVPLINNTTIDGDRTFTLAITNAVGATLGATTNATFTLLDNDSTVQFDTNAVTGAESTRSVVLTVVRAGGLVGPATVHYAATSGSAAVGTDVSNKSGTLSFAANETNKTITLSLVNDTSVETNETFTVVLSSPTGEAQLGTNSTMTVTVGDNDSRLSFETNAVTVAENAGTVSLNVLRTGTLTYTNTIRYTVVAGTAGKTDYTATNGTLTFAPNATNATITIGIVDDSLVESDETFKVLLSNPSTGALISGTNTAYITITDNDIGLAFTAASYSVAENATNVTLTIVQTGNTNGTASVDYATHDITAVGGNDYTSTNGTLNFGPGTNSLTITVPVLDDSVVESNETFHVTLANPSGALLLANSNAVVTILEDDSTLAFTTNAVSILESASSVTLTVLRTGGTNFEATVDFLSTDGTATDGADYTATNGTLTFAPGVRQKTVVVPLLNDTSVEGDETFSLGLTNITGSILGANTNLVVTIVDNDSVFNFTTNAASISEAAGTTTFTVTRTGGVAGAATVHYSTTNGTATAGSDFSALSGTLKFAAGQTNKTVSVRITNDKVVDPNETFTLGLSAPTGEGTLGTNTVVTITIIDNDFASGDIVSETGTAEIVITVLDVLADKTSVVEVQGPLGASVVVEASSDLTIWQELASGNISGAPFQCQDANSDGQSMRFYRVRQPAPSGDSQP
jgi:hypothetical protein